MPSEQAGGDGSLLEFVIFVENMWYPSTELLHLSQRVKMASDGVMRASHFLSQFSHGLM